MKGKKLKETTKLFFYTSVFVILLLTNNINAQTGWFWQNPLPQGNSLNNIRFINVNTGYSVGRMGTLVKTTNCGLNWILQTTPTRKILQSIYLIDSNTILACGDSGIIMKSYDGGISWATVPAVTIQSLNRIFFVDAYTGYIAGNTGTILKSINQGNNWIMLQSGVNNSLFGIYFTNSLTGYVGGYGTFLKTSNSGINWVNSPIPNSAGILDIQFLGQDTGFAAGFYSQAPSDVARFFKTTNAGVNWTYTPISGTRCSSLYFINVNTGFVSSGGILRTTNSGLNWSLVTSFQTSFNSIDFTNNTVFSCGNGGSIIKSTDIGLSWVNQTNPFLEFSNSDVFFVNSNVGYICGDNFGDSMLLKTTNGGNNWFQIRGPNYNNYFSLHFTSIDTGYLVKGTSIIYKTTNGGINWLNIQTGSSYGFRKVLFINSNTGFAGGYKGTIYKTTDAGGTWVFKASKGGTIYDMSFPDNYTGFAVDAGYGIIKSTDGGDSWYDLPYIPNVFYIPRVSFVNANVGFILGDDNSYHNIWKTTNSGLTWQSKLAVTFFRLNDITINQSGIGYVVGENGKIFKTFNFGENWYNLNSITDNSLYSIFSINDTICFAVGSYRTILKTTTGGGTIIEIEPISNQLPLAFHLHQNFPNPFNATTKIKFDVSNLEHRTSNIELIIYDILGREIETLINQQLKPGSYEIEWDAKNFPSGVYFYKLESEDFVQTKKMVLLK